MKKFDLLFYEDSKGYCPMLDFAKTLKQQGDKKSQNLANSIFRKLDRLRECGTMDGMPDFEKIENKKHKRWQIRVKHVTGIYRIFVCPWGGKSYVILNCFLKKSVKTPPNQIKLAENLMDDFIKRQGGKKDA